MRIDRVEFRAFGPFTGQTLDLEAGRHGLHVVFGRNEAGKSSALRAISAALFSIGGQTSDDFVHEYNALRIAMTLRDRNGDRLSFVRRKANRNALRDGDDGEPLHDDALRRFLGGVDREEFARVFGLDHERLRAGGELLLETAAGNGSGAASALIAAALGVQDLRGVGRAIEEEAGRLFKPGASKPEINALLARWKELRREATERVLGASEWREKKDEYARRIAERDAAEERQRELERRRAEFELVARNRGRVARRRQLIEALAARGAVPDLPEDFESRRREIEERRREAGASRDLHAAEVRRRNEELARHGRDFALLDHLDEFKELRKLSIEVAKGLADRERRRLELAAAGELRDARARELGLETPPPPAVIETLRAALEARERCEELVREHARITTSSAKIGSELSRHTLDRDGIARRRDARPDPIDPAPLARALAAARSCGDLEPRIAQLELDVAAAERAIAAQATALAGVTIPPERFAAAPVPGPTTIADFEARFLELDRERDRARAKRAELGAERARHEAESRKIEGGGPVPSEDELAGRRRKRESLWRLVRRAWLDGADVKAESAALDPDRPLPDSFERSIDEADRTADGLRRESARVAAFEAARERIAQVDRELQTIAETDREREERRARLETEWRDAWRESGVVPGRPAAMKDLLAVRARIADLLEGKRKALAALDALRGRRDEALSELKAAMIRCGGEPGESNSLPTLAAAADARHKALERDEKTRDDDRRELERLEKEIARCELERAELERTTAEWRASFESATRGLPRVEGDRPEEALRALHRVAALLSSVDDVASLESRIAKIERDEAHLLELARAFRAAHAADLPPEPVPEFVSAVEQRVDDLKRDRERHSSEDAERKRAEDRLRAAEIAFERESRALHDLAKEAGASTIEELAGIVQAAEEKRGLRAELARIETDLLAESLPIEAIERRVEALDRESCGDGNPGTGADPAAAARIAAQLDEARDAAKQRRDEAAAAKTELEALERGIGTAEIAAEMAAISARVSELAMRYARLTLGSRLLGAAVERFRKKNETPLLRRASVHFERLTRGAYRTVDCDVDDGGTPFFQVQAPSGAVKRLDSLSDGTRDQLHLALVLGSLELRFDGGAEPMPLVLDDVLVHFDDERSLAALEALAEFSRATQVLLFTHHERIREQAESLARGGKAVFVQTLAR